LKILFILSRFPYPLDKGDKLRAYYQLKNLSKHHQVTLFSLNDGKLTNEAIAHVKQYCAHVEVQHLSKFQVGINLFKALFNKLPLQVAYFYSHRAQQKLNQLITAQKPDHIICQLIRTTEYVKHIDNIPKTLDFMDVFSKGTERRVSGAPFYLRTILKMEHARLSAYENHIFSHFNNLVIISEQDRSHIQHPEKLKISIISNGVDTDYFKPLAHKKEYDILFNGNMQYPPNIEGAEYLVNKILPLVRKKHPDVKVLISGTNPNKRVQALASGQVTVSGWVNDIRENFARSKILVAPMFLSIGLQNKLLEAMAMQIPCITSTLANNALGAEKDKSILVADTPEQYAKHISALLTDEKKAGEIAMNAYSFVLANYQWQQETAKLEKLISTK